MGLDTHDTAAGGLFYKVINLTIKQNICEEN